MASATVEPLNINIPRHSINNKFCLYAMELSLWINIIKFMQLMKVITAEILLAMCTCWTCCSNKHTLEGNSQGLTLPPLLTPTVYTTYCDVVAIACLKTSQFLLCGTSIHDVQKSPIRYLGSVAGNADEVEISTVTRTQCPAHSDIHSSTDIFRKANTGEGGNRRGTWMRTIYPKYQTFI